MLRKLDQGQSGQATVLMQHATDPGRYIFLAIQFMVVSRRFHERFWTFATMVQARLSWSFDRRSLQRRWWAAKPFRWT